MTRVLVVDEALPWPADSGKRIRTTALLERLAREFEIVLLHHDAGDTSPAGREQAAAAGIRVVPVPRRPLRKRGPRFAWDLLRNLFLFAPYMVMAHRTRAMRRAITDELEAGIDVVHVEWTPLVANVPGDVSEPVCIAAHNVESAIWHRYLENERNPLKRAYIRIQAKKVLRFEHRAFAEAEAVTAVSEGDATRLRGWAAGDDRVVVVPNGVDVAFFAPQEGAFDEDLVLFVGALDWRPNQDAVLWYLNDVHGRVRRRRPNARFAVVGRKPPAWLAERVRAAAGTALHADVPDVRPHVARAAVCAVPLRIGGGSRLKICEALAMRRPVVSTTVGAEGLQLDGTVAIADGAEAFAAAVVAALERPEAAAARAREGHARVRERYDWDAIAPAQAALWRRLAETPA